MWILLLTTPKTMVFSQKPWFSVPKTMVLNKKNCVFYKTMVFSQKLQFQLQNPWFSSPKTVVFSPKKLVSLKTVVFAVFEFKTTKLLISFQSRERNQGQTSIFPQKTTKSVDLGLNPQILWFLSEFKVKNYISHSTFKRTSKHTLKSMDFCIVYPIDSFQYHLT